MSKHAKPAPVAKVTVCSMCGLDWHSHGEDPTTEDCIRLLKLELARRPITITGPAPWVMPVSPIYPWGRYPSHPIIWSSTTNPNDQRTPRLPAVTCKAVSS